MRRTSISVSIENYIIFATNGSRNYSWKNLVGCRFGDTVNTASRMSSTSLPDKIQVSESTQEMLRHFGSFTLMERGATFVKGKGSIITFWLDSLDRT